MLIHVHVHSQAAEAHVTYLGYRGAVSGLLHKMRDLNVLGHSQVFWLENTAQPLRQDRYTFQYKDWRTYHRLILYDAIAKDLINDLNMAISVIPVPYVSVTLFSRSLFLFFILHEHTPYYSFLCMGKAFYSTLALFDKMCDCGHYDISAKFPQLLGLLDILYNAKWSPSLRTMGASSGSKQHSFITNEDR